MPLGHNVHSAAVWPSFTPLSVGCWRKGPLRGQGRGLCALGCKLAGQKLDRRARAYWGAMRPEWQLAWPNARGGVFDPFRDPTPLRGRF